MNNKPATRRTALKTCLGLVAATGAIGLTSRARAQSAKADPASVGYQTKPSSGQECDGCSQFIAPNSCQIVAGAISPTGWCQLYSPKS